MKKADYKFHRDRRQTIQRDSKQSVPMWYEESNPIYIPKRKKKK